MRKRLLLIALCFLVYGAKAKAQSVCPGLPQGSPVNYAKEPLTVSNTAIPFTKTVYDTGLKRPAFAQVRLEGANNIRFQIDGSVPTSSVGWLTEGVTGSNISFTICGEAMVRSFQMIRTGSDASVTVFYFGY